MTKPSLLLVVAIIASATLITFIIAVAYGQFVVQSWGAWQNAADFGESYGALNAVFSALGFFAVALALILQYRGLHDSQEQVQTTIRLQLLTAYLLTDAVPPGDKATIVQAVADDLKRLLATTSHTTTPQV